MPKINFNDSRKEVRVGGRLVHLAPKEYQILRVLVATTAIVSRRQLLEKVWGLKGEDHALIQTRTVDQHISRLRRKVGQHTILTSANYGYKMAAR